MAAKTFEQVLDEVRGKPILVANRGIPVPSIGELSSEARLRGYFFE